MKIGKTISNIIMKEFNRKPVYNEKLKPYNGKIKTHFHHKNTKRRFSVYLSITNID